RNISRRAKNERGLWQRRYWEHMIHDERDFIQHVDYIHYNPVKHGYTSKASDWSFSSIHRYIKLGVVGEDWGANEMVIGDGDFGEF
ncbi:MAG: transposase, partial [Gammaproteobacteria bacterium]|nr:transposase [Gammaproteobacteria bacterium]